jgi:hypothetical protein
MDELTARLDLLRRYLTDASRCRDVPAALDRLREQY